MKKTFIYPANFKPVNVEGDFLVSFPDLPEARTFGRGFQETMERAQDCLATALRSRVRDDESFPEPGGGKSTLGMTMVAADVELSDIYPTLTLYAVSVVVVAPDGHYASRLVAVSRTLSTAVSWAERDYANECSADASRIVLQGGEPGSRYPALIWSGDIEGDGLQGGTPEGQGPEGQSYGYVVQKVEAHS